MKRPISVPFAVGLAQAALLSSAYTSVAGGMAFRPEIWLPEPAAVHTLHMDLLQHGAEIILAQSCEGEGCDNDTTGGGGDDDDDDGGETEGPLPEPTPEIRAEGDPRPTGLPAAVGLNDRNTDLIVQAIISANSTCVAHIIPLEYRIDCIRLFYLSLAKSLPDTGDYVPIKNALLKGAKELDDIVTANVDPVAPRVVAPVGGKPSAPRTSPMRAIKPAAVPAATAQAEQVIAETSLVILRSGEDPARRAEHYQEIAAAVDSNIVLLRSA